MCCHGTYTMLSLIPWTGYFLHKKWRHLKISFVYTVTVSHLLAYHHIAFNVMTYSRAKFLTSLPPVCCIKSMHKKWRHLKCLHVYTVTVCHLLVYHHIDFNVMTYSRADRNFVVLSHEQELTPLENVSFRTM